MCRTYLIKLGRIGAVTASHNDHFIAAGCQLGRIVLPIEMRRTLDIAEKDALEIYVEGSSVILKKYKPSCIFCDATKDVTNFKGKNVCPKCLKELKGL